eukprot:TRINITY_DN32262_c0_g1_i1.p1 TRINITY_DN32262_c0_g1~~TRINITY_DN32262_c0_g1_i1.p1  ORF type:complete len:137 (+),score=17.04 TRINITY_DN32262_c0_g1_i1:93-503(+)
MDIRLITLLCFFGLVAVRATKIDSSSTHSALDLQWAWEPCSKPLKDVRRGDYVRLLGEEFYYSKVGRVEHVVCQKTRAPEGFEVLEIKGSEPKMGVTPWHPVKAKVNGEWQFPSVAREEQREKGEKQATRKQKTAM